MAIYTEKEIKPQLAVLFLVLSFFLLFSVRQIGDRELYWNEGTHAAIAQEISFQQSACTAHGVVSLQEFPLFHLIAGGLVKCGVPVVLALRLISLGSLFILAIVVGVAASRQHGARAGIVAAAVMLSCNIVLEKSLEGYPDTMMMLLLMCGWLIWFYFGAGGGGWSRAWIFAFFFCGLAFYTAGFKAVAIFIIPLIFMRRPLTIWSKLRRRGFVVGLLIFACFILLWAIPLATSEARVRPFDLFLSPIKYLEHLLLFPFGVVFRLLPWSIFIWAPFCVGLHPLDPHPIFSRFLRTIFFSLFFLLWFSPLATPRDISLLVPPAAILSGIYYWIIIRRYGGHIFNLLYPFNWCVIGCGCVVLGLYLLPPEWWRQLFSLSRGVGFRELPDYFWSGIIRGGLICLAGIFLIGIRRGGLPMWLHINILACVGMMFFWSTIHPYKAQNSNQRELGAKIKKVLTDKPNSDIIYKYKITGLYGAMHYAGANVKKIYSLDELPGDTKYVYLICTGFPELHPRRDWTQLLMVSENLKKQLFLYQGELKDDPYMR
jgi:4-amino-4-deoxy-L-arabinose transferase-like glycosyltransferase